MRITVIRTGGFGGALPAATLDTAGRPDADELAHLAGQAVREGLGEAPVGVPDGFHYEVSIENGSPEPSDGKCPRRRHRPLRRPQAHRGPVSTGEKGAQGRSLTTSPRLKLPPGSSRGVAGRLGPSAAGAGPIAPRVFLVQR